MNDTLKLFFFISALFVLYYFLTKRCNCRKKKQKVIRQKTYFGVPGKRPPNLPVRWHIQN
ncbi:MAG: hypothetical protein CXT73_02310 [Methanobacteriota archaeon]|nr:MAG: hypothetical protein CXT73_02310 [Euryarchaeota archaeon]